jgi:nucleoside 2-deoxyribosyltransferase
MHEVKYIYVAGPYTIGQTDINIRNAILAAEKIIQMGACPYVPHQTLVWGMISPHPHDWWLTYDFNWIDKCDAVLRLSGESKGADSETGYAQLHEIPVFYNMEDLQEWLKRSP